MLLGQHSPGGHPSHQYHGTDTYACPKDAVPCHYRACGKRIRIRTGMLFMERVDHARHSGQAQNAPAEVIPPAKRRRFTTAYKLRILRTAELCVAPGELDALLRKEGLYSSHLTLWRKQRDRGSLYGSTQAARELRQLESENRRLRMELKHARRELSKAEMVIEVQKKICTLFWRHQRDRS